MHRTLAILLASLLMWALPASSQERPATNLITHSSVEIQASPSAIWPHIVEPNQWKQGLDLHHYSGEPGQAKEVLVARDPNDPDVIVFVVENSEMVPNRRRTIKLVDPAGTLLGFASWTLEPHGSATVVSYHVYSETVLPSGTSTQQAADLERQGYEENKTRFDAELVALKELVEGRR